jgi:hypothetical protein
MISIIIFVLPAFTLLLAALYPEELLIWIPQVSEIPGIVGMPSEDASYIFNNFNSIVAEPSKSPLSLDGKTKDAGIEEDISISYPARYIFVLLVLSPDVQLCGSDIQNHIKKRFREKISNNALYPLLHRMCKDHLIDNQSKEQRMHYYCITEIGKKVLRRFWREFKLAEKSFRNIN